MFSQSLITLDVIEKFLSTPEHGNWVEGLDYFRLDGSTPADTRSWQMTEFNANSNERYVYVCVRVMYMCMCVRTVICVFVFVCVCVFFFVSVFVTIHFPATIKRKFCNAFGTSITVGTLICQCGRH